MKYNEKENELINMVCETNEDIRNSLYEQNEDIINFYVKKYTPIAKALNIDTQDLYQEALIGFADALNNFDDSKKASFKTFLSLCVDRKLIKVINKAKKHKNTTVQEVLSLDYEYADTGLPLIEVITDNTQDILEQFSEEEQRQEIDQTIIKNLSSNETEVYHLLKEGLNYQEIAQKLKKSPKQIDNTIQRIKNKVKQITKGDEK